MQGAYIKIGFFGSSDSELIYQDEIHGPIIKQIDETVDMVYNKYLKALIDYEGIQRIETYMLPKEAFREILLNAVNHKDYSRGVPIQISVYDDKLYVWNDGRFPEILNAENIYEKHSSIPFNPKIADTLFKAGMIESWGRGFDKIREECEKTGTPLPEYKISDRGIMVLCRPNKRYERLAQKYAIINHNDTITDTITDTINDTINDTIKKLLHDNFSKNKQDNLIRILNCIKINNMATRSEIASMVGISESTVVRDINKLIKLGIISRVGPKKNGTWVINNV